MSILNIIHRNRLKVNLMSDTLSRRKVLELGAVAASGLLLPKIGFAAEPKRRVLVWSEGSAPKDVYPKDINNVVADGLKASLKDWEVVVGSLSDADQGVPDNILQKTDVLVWWGHLYHDKIKDALVERIVKRVKDDGMGFIPLHSGTWAKAFKKLIGASGDWKGGYYEDGSSVKLIVKDKNHPIAHGITDFVLDKTERYSEPFDAPKSELIFDGIYTKPDGKTERSRQGLAWTIGKGKIFYFQPGHETYPTFFDKTVQKIMHNAVLWAAP
jgi:trehalose utilization protein